MKDLVAKASSGGNQVKPGFQMGGGFRTPSYRTGLFLDPKGRGGSTGYDMAVALPGLQSGVEGDAEMFKENNKVFDVTDGNIEFEVNNVDKEAGEIGGERSGADRTRADAATACLVLWCARRVKACIWGGGGSCSGLFIPVRRFPSAHVRVHSPMMQTDCNSSLVTVRLVGWGGAKPSSSERLTVVVCVCSFRDIKETYVPG